MNLERPREPSSGVARRVRSTPGAGAVAAAAAMRQAWTLRLAPLLLIAPLVTSLIAGNVGDVVGLALALLLCYAGMFLVERGLRAEADYVRRALATAPRPPSCWAPSWSGSASSSAALAPVAPASRCRCCSARWPPWAASGLRHGPVQGQGAGSGTRTQGRREDRAGDRGGDHRGRGASCARLNSSPAASITAS